MSVQDTLAQLETAQLVRHLIDAEPAYIFKHALTQDAAYQSLLQKQRREIHRRVAFACEQLYADQLDEHAALLAQHFECAEEDRKALEYLQRAAEYARRSFAAREQVELISRALAIAERRNDNRLKASLHTERGKALTELAAWTEAKKELESALALLSPTQLEQRAQVLLYLANVYRWLFDAQAAHQVGEEALALAEQLGNDKLASSAMCGIAFWETAQGRPRAGIAMFERAFSRARELRTPELIQAISLVGLTRYWLGEYQPAIEANETAITRAFEIFDNTTIMQSFGILGLAQAGMGHYGAALDTFRRAREFAREHGGGPWLARAVAMEGGVHLDLFDFAGAETLAREAREIGRAAKFGPAQVSAAIDLLLNFARRGLVHGAEHLMKEVADAIPLTYGSHRWLWQNRFVQARAELALARSQYDEAIEKANESLEQSRATFRVKYEIAALVTRGQARLAKGDHAAGISDLDTAHEIVQPTDNPTLFLRTAIALLQVRGDDTLATRARVTARQISNSLPSGELRARFDAYVSELI
ncbi:MAG: hypothetical protein HY868_19345 [Chloroflexi bacterium]|nr:hypothetical protein [Chloroflexota bacterium]